MYNSSYGFTDYETREAKVTDYVKANGTYWSISNQYLDNGYYWLRSPYYSYSNSAYCVNDGGGVEVSNECYVNASNDGVRVACNINLK